MSTLERYRALFDTVPGWFMFEAMIVWEFFLQKQNTHHIAGHFLEVGVYHGKSAILGAMYLRPEELCILNDIGDLTACEAALTTFRPENNIYLRSKSSEVPQHPTVIAQKGRFRWVHIDGDHTGYSTMRDLTLAADLLADAGIICVDDFFNARYPQLSAAVFRFLFDRHIDFKLLFCGSNKAYLCRTGAYAFYERLIRSDFPRVCRRHGLNMPLQKSSYVHDFGCFSVLWPETERSAREIAGLDADLDEIVF